MRGCRATGPHGSGKPNQHQFGLHFQKLVDWLPAATSNYTVIQMFFNYSFGFSLISYLQLTLASPLIW